MPLYQYTCNKCFEMVEEIRTYEERQAARAHECGGPLVYEITGGKQGKPAFTMSGIGWNGEKIPGNFGGDYREDRFAREKRNKRLDAAKAKRKPQ